LAQTLKKSTKEEVQRTLVVRGVFERFSRLEEEVEGATPELSGAQLGLAVHHRVDDGTVHGGQRMV
jgi:hypothetical protein